jgi:hypothetical protein
VSEINWEERYHQERARAELRSQMFVMLTAQFDQVSRDLESCRSEMEWLKNENAALRRLVRIPGGESRE